MPAPVTKATYADYLAAAEASDVRLELAGTEILAMSGGSSAHARLAARLIRALGNALDGTPCEVYTSDMRVRRLDEPFAAYPDVTVVCGGEQVGDDDPHGLTNPRVVIEVLSPSTEAWDRGGKSAHYRRIPSVQEIVLVHQDKRTVEVHRRNEAGRFELFESPADGRVELVSVGVDLPMHDLYDGIVDVA